MKTQQMDDGGAFNLYATWWRLGASTPGATWGIVDYSLPRSQRPAAAVVDDFGKLVQIPNAH